MDTHLSNQVQVDTPKVMYKTPATFLDEKRAPSATYAGIVSEINAQSAKLNWGSGAASITGTDLLVELLKEANIKLPSIDDIYNKVTQMVSGTRITVENISDVMVTVIKAVEATIKSTKESKTVATMFILKKILSDVVNSVDAEAVDVVMKKVLPFLLDGLSDVVTKPSYWCIPCM